MSDEEKQAVSLNRRVREAMIYFGLPHWVEIKNEGVPENSTWGHLQHGVQEDIQYFIDNDKFETASHIARVTLDSVAGGDFFSLNELKYRKFFESFIYAAGNHDLGKFIPEISKLSEKKDSFTPEDMEKMKEHVGISVGLSNSNNLLGKGIIAYHHFWQKNSYLPAGISKEWGLQLTPEIEVGSKLLAIIDFHDSAATRVNAKFLEKPRVLKKEEVRKLLFNEYGNLEFNYEGENFPSLHTHGDVIIESFYRQGVFGRKNPLNPYPAPYSFIRRSGILETWRERKKVKAREKEIAKKLEMHWGK